MDMKNKKLKIGLGVAVVALVVGGCTSVGFNTIARMAPAGEQVLMGMPVTIGSISTKEICSRFQNDERCKDIDAYKGDIIQVRDTGFAVDDIHILVRKDVNYPRRSIVRIRVKGNAPGYFEGVAAEGLSTPDCYRMGGLGRGTTGPGGVICPKYGYDYRNVNWVD